MQPKAINNQAADLSREFRSSSKLGLSSKKKVIIADGKLFYQQQSVDLGHLTDVSATAKTLMTKLGIGTSFCIKLTDRAGNQIKLPLGRWADQDDLLSIISGYAAIAGAVVDKPAEELIESAKNDY